ncbi:unnamed protein product [Cercospora beticola]|nr:unnamed protein product [Cercospora beticola]
MYMDENAQLPQALNGKTTTFQQKPPIPISTNVNAVKSELLSGDKTNQPSLVSVRKSENGLPLTHSIWAPPGVSTRSDARTHPHSTAVVSGRVGVTTRSPTSIQWRPGPVIKSGLSNNLYR